MTRLKAIRIYTDRPTVVEIQRAQTGVSILRFATAFALWWVGHPNRELEFHQRADCLVRDTEHAELDVTLYWDDEPVPWLEGVDVDAELEAQAQWRAALLA